MTRYLRSPSVCPYYNLALEQYVFDSLDRGFGYFMLWQNDRTIVVGRHQDTLSEINAEYVGENGVRVVRRLSGGGAVYHDLGNVNFTFIADSTGKRSDFKVFADYIIAALEPLGIKAEYSGRNDITVGGLKFSGNAQYQKEGRVMHHGTILFDSDVAALEKALMAPADSAGKRGVKSVASRVTNLRPLLKKDMDVGAFIEHLRDSVGSSLEFSDFALTASDVKEIEELRDGRYALKEWNFSDAPGFSIRKRRRIEGVGTIEVRLDVIGGKIDSVRFFGDYFGEDAAPLSLRLIGQKAEKSSISSAVDGIDLGRYFNGIDPDEFIALLSEQEN